MPKQTWNISDFSGGLNEIVDPRDLQENESTLIDNLVAHHPGSMKLGGVFLPMSAGSGNIVVPSLAFGFAENTKYDPITFVQPSEAFVKFTAGEATISGDVVTLTLNADTNLSQTTLPFRRNQIINIIKVAPGVMSGSYETTNLQGHSYTISQIGAGFIKFNIDKQPDGSTSWSFAAHTWYIAVGGRYIPNGLGVDRRAVIANTENNNYVLLNNGFGKYGFFNTVDKCFVGNDNALPDSLGLDQHYFDTRYLWNMDNRNNQKLETGSGDITNTHDDLIKTLETSYIDGVVRCVEESPKYWENGHVRRPVGLYFIKEHKKFNSKTYLEGWYPLTTHCLSPTQMRRISGQNSATSAATTIHNNSAGNLLASASTPTTPNDINRININASQTGSSITGDWQFQSGSEHSSIGIGISFIYDDINHKDFGTFAQESSISFMNSSEYSDGSQSYVIAINGSNDRCLTIKYALKDSKFNSNGDSYSFLSDGSNTFAIPEQRGSIKANGDSNWEAWNPRIVGANLYLTATALETYKSPLWLATIDFTKSGGSYSHDGKQSSTWTTTGDLMTQEILNIEALPIMDFRTKNGFSHDEPNEIWWKTSAVVNRKMYAANISYFEEIEPVNSPSKAVNFPDRIIASPDANKFDLMPISTSMDIAKSDGQDITKLLNFNNELLVFKNNDLVVIDCSGVDEIIKDTFYGKGIYSGGQCVATADAVYFCNKNGFYVYNGESVTDISINKFTSIHWKKNIYSNNTRLLYDEQYNLVLITATTNSYINKDSKDDIDENISSKYMYIYNVAANAFFFKSSPVSSYQSDTYLSNGINIDGILYAATNTLNNNLTTESASVQNTVEYVEGVRAKYRISYHTNDESGTQIGFDGDACQTNYLNTLMTYLKIYNTSGSGSWKTLNANGAFLPAQDQTTVNDTNNTFEQIAQMENAIITKETLYVNINSAIDPDYMISVGILIGPESNSLSDNEYNDVWLTLTLEATKVGTAYTIVPQDLSSVSAIYGANTDSPVDSGKLGIVFANNSTEGALGAISPQIGNIRVIKDYNDSENYRAGVDPVVPVWRYTPNRNGQYTKGVEYTISFIVTEIDNISVINFTYRTGVDYLDGGNDYGGVLIPDTNDISSTATDAEINDAVVSNFYNNLLVANITSVSNNPDYNGWHLGSFATCDFGGSSGSKYIEISLMDIPWVTEKIKWQTEFSVNGTSFNGDLQVWTNDLPLNANDNSLYSPESIEYITKDIDFGEPNVRKKVYKAYITYQYGSGNIVCYYKINQSNTWTMATVKNNTGGSSNTTGRLDASNVQTRGELDFGIATNNIYSIQLRFKSTGIVPKFEINDITLIYRMKNTR